MANYNRIKTWTAEVLSAADLNAEFDNVVSNSQCESIDDYSNTVSEMKLQTNPGELGTESQATKLSGEIERLRFAIEEAKSAYCPGVAYWFETPVSAYQFSQASDVDGLTVFSSNTAFTGNVLKLKTNEESNGTFNFILCESDSDGTPATEFSVDQTGNVVCGTITSGTVNGATITSTAFNGATLSGGTISGGTMTATEVTVNSIAVTQALVPVGSIIPFYDFDAALAFNTDYWVYCDGGTATVGGSSRTLPDLSGRYLVGFGTDGGGDIDSAAWATAAVGAASHQVDLSAVGAAHTHDDGTLKFECGRNTGTPTRALQFFDTNGSYFTALNVNMDGLQPTTGGSGDYTYVGSEGTFYTANGSGSTGSGGSPGSATQSIQPSSIRVRYIMRKA